MGAVITEDDRSRSRGGAGATQRHTRCKNGVALRSRRGERLALLDDKSHENLLWAGHRAAAVWNARRNLASIAGLDMLPAASARDVRLGTPAGAAGRVRLLGLPPHSNNVRSSVRFLTPTGAAREPAHASTEPETLTTASRCRRPYRHRRNLS